MKRPFFTFIAIFFIIGFDLPCFASYVVNLKNGKQFVVEDYWEENGQIKLSLYGGVAGFRQDQILSIEKSGLPYSWVQPEHQDSYYPPAEREEEVQKPAPTPLSEKEKKEFLDKKSWIRKENEKLRDQLKTAKEKNDIDGIKTAKRRLKNLNKKFSQLLKKIKKQNNGSIPEWF